MTMAEQIAALDERRAAERFSMRLPVTLVTQEGNISAFTRDISARGVFFYFAFTESELVNQDVEFTIEFPPELTLCTSLKVHCAGKVLRKQNAAEYETGVAVRICDYTFVPVEEPGLATGPL